jgi:hypothetical protein
MKKRKYILAIPILSILASCGKTDLPHVSGVTDADATAIVVDHNGVLLDFVTVTPTQELDRIEFLAPASGEDISVFAVGPNATNVPSFYSVSSSHAPNHAGKVTVEIENGFIQMVSGNTISFANPPSAALLQKVAKLKRSGSYKYLPSTVLVYTDAEIRRLVEDDAGNLIPPDITTNERIFLDTVIPAIRKKDLSTLRPLIHKREDDHMPFSTVERYLKVLLKQDFATYRFTRIDPAHPDNRDVVEADNSLPVRWILRVNYRTMSPFTHCDIRIGVNNGRLKFPTTYGKRNS